MDARTNNIKKATAYQRESAGRTASERLLDQHYKQSHNRIKELEKGLMISSQPVKKAKVELSDQHQPPSSEEVLARIIKHFTKEDKLLKSLELLEKLFGSEGFRQLSTESLLDALLRLVEITASRSCEVRVYQGIKQVFSKAEAQIKEESIPKRTLTARESELWDVLMVFGLDLSLLWSDDSFEFSRAVTLFKKHIVEFQVDFDKLNKLEALLCLKLETQEVTAKSTESKIETALTNQAKHLLSSSSDQVNLLKRSLIFKVVCRLFPLAIMGWRKSSLDPFLREFNTQFKERILSKQQKMEFTQLYQEHLNSKIKGSYNQQLQFKIDKEILSTPLNSHHTVKDNRREFLTGDSVERWSSRQHN